MTETAAQLRSSNLVPPTNDGLIDPGNVGVSGDHVISSDVSSDGQISPVLTPRDGSSGSASISSCSSHETVVSVGVRQPEVHTRPRDAGSPIERDRNSEPETVCCNGDSSTWSGNEVFNSEMTLMSPLVNKWRRRQQAETEKNSTSDLYSNWSGKSGSSLRSDPHITEVNSGGRRGRSTHGYSSDTEAFLRTLHRRGTTSGQPVTVSGHSPSAEYPTWHRDWTTTSSPTSAVKPLEVCRTRILSLC